MPAVIGHHASFALPLEFLDFVVIEESKPMQTLFRSMLAPLHPRRIRMFDDFQGALQAMVNEPPTLVICDWRVGRRSAYGFIKMLRARQMTPLCFSAVMIVTAYATQGIVERAMAAGAHAVLVKPVSPTLLAERIMRIVADHRRFVLAPDGTYAIEGVQGRLAEIRTKAEALNRARAYQRTLTMKVPPPPAGSEVLTRPDSPARAAEDIAARVAAEVVARSAAPAPRIDLDPVPARAGRTPRRRPVKGWGTVAKV